MLEYILLREDCDIDPGSVNRMDKEHTSQHCNSDQNVGVVCESLVQVTVSVHRAYRTVSTPKNYTPMVWIASIGDKNQEIVQDIILARDTELRALIQK